MPDADNILQHLQQRFAADPITEQQTVDEILTLWVPGERIISILQYLKATIPQPFAMLYDLCGVDERNRTKRSGIPAADFTVVYTLYSFARNNFLRLKVALKGEFPNIPSSHKVYENANWYEREVYDMFGIVFNGHPHLQRILMPLTWSGHP